VLVEILDQQLGAVAGIPNMDFMMMTMMMMINTGLGARRGGGHTLWISFAKYYFEKLISRLRDTHCIMSL
jgi:hypothetical protein